MQSPLPGMDPYLEQHWGDVHHNLVTFAQGLLNEHLPRDLGIARLIGANEPERSQPPEKEKGAEREQQNPVGNAESRIQVVSDQGLGLEASTSLGVRDLLATADGWHPAT